MAVFVSASDESSGKNQNDDFFLGGWVAPEEDWSRYFAPAWQERVLDGPPKIPHLHMTDIRSPKWREQFGLSRLKADDRIDEAIAIINTMGSLRPIITEIDAGYFREQFKEHKLIAASGGVKVFEPDYLSFVAYAYGVLKHLEIRHPEAEKVDFVVERNGDITKHIQEFHAHLAVYLESQGHASLARLVGELIPAGKDRIPLQAADVLCWYMGRGGSPETMDDDDKRRYNTLASRKGAKIPLQKEIIVELSKTITDQEAKKRI